MIQAMVPKECVKFRKPIQCIW